MHVGKIQAPLEIPEVDVVLDKGRLAGIASDRAEDLQARLLPEGGLERVLVDVVNILGGDHDLDTPVRRRPAWRKVGEQIADIVLERLDPRGDALLGIVIGRIHHENDDAPALVRAVGRADPTDRQHSQEEGKQDCRGPSHALQMVQFVTLFPCLILPTAVVDRQASPRSGKHQGFLSRFRRSATVERTRVSTVGPNFTDYSLWTLHTAGAASLS